MPVSVWSDLGLRILYTHGGCQLALPAGSARQALIGWRADHASSVKLCDTIPSDDGKCLRQFQSCALGHIYSLSLQPGDAAVLPRFQCHWKLWQHFCLSPSLTKVYMEVGLELARSLQENPADPISIHTQM